jgi:hypothetical protein
MIYDIWLDDERIPDDDEMVWLRDSESAITLLSKHWAYIDNIYLDHDLGDEAIYGTGYQVILYMENEVFKYVDEYGAKMPHRPTIHILTANPVARRKMIAARESIRRLEAGVEQKRA